MRINNIPCKLFFAQDRLILNYLLLHCININKFYLKSKYTEQFKIMNTAVENTLEQARPVFPFTAIVGQEEMKLALILKCY